MQLTLRTVQKKKLHVDIQREGVCMCLCATNKAHTLKVFKNVSFMTEKERDGPSTGLVALIPASSLLVSWDNRPLGTNPAFRSTRIKPGPPHRAPVLRRGPTAYAAVVGPVCPILILVP